MDTALGLVGLAVFILGIIAFAAAVTYAVIRLSPAKPQRDVPGGSG